MNLSVQIKLLRATASNTQLPDYSTDGSAGVDLRVCLDSSDKITVAPGEVILLPTGIAIYIADNNYCAMLVPRSGLGHKKGIILGNTVGIIDSDYQGEVMISCWNRSDTAYTISNGDRIAQLLFVPVVQAKLKVVDSFQITARGEQGFGHTGVS